MTDEEFAAANELKHEIWDRLLSVLDEMTKSLPRDWDDNIRDQLTQQFRFWR